MNDNIRDQGSCWIKPHHVSFWSLLLSIDTKYSFIQSPAQKQRIEKSKHLEDRDEEKPIRHPEKLKILGRKGATMMGRSMLISSIAILTAVVFDIIILPSPVESAGASLYSTSQFVQSISTPDEFENFMNDHSIWMIQFCTSQSTKCKSNSELIKQYDALASISRGLYNIGYIDVSSDDGKQISQTFNVISSDGDVDFTKFKPTFLMFGDDRKNPTKYTGVQDAQNMLNKIMEFALETLQVRARGGSPGSSSGGGSSNSGGSSSSSSRRSSRSKSKVVQLTKDNFEKEILNSPLVSAVACKFSVRCCRRR